jgi:histidyl-tRNA synthetase
MSALDRITLGDPRILEIVATASAAAATAAVLTVRNNPVRAEESDKAGPATTATVKDLKDTAATVERVSDPISGFSNLNYQQQPEFCRWLRTVGEIYETYGFTPIHLRPFERLPALSREGGDVKKQIFGVYRLDGDTKTGLAIPFDHTVPFALYVAQQGEAGMPFPYKRYDLGLSYRGESPQPGRFRAFIQADVDIVGRNLGLTADVECILAMTKALQRLDIGRFTVSINHIDIVRSIVRFFGVPDHLQPNVLRNIDKLDKLSPADVVEEISKISGLEIERSRIEEMVEKFVSKHSIDAYTFDHEYGRAATDGLKNLKDALQMFAQAGLSPEQFVFAPGMVRGLEYYTGFIFETYLDGFERYGSIASGGRYNNLVGDYSERLKDIEGVGGSIGLTRLFDVMSREGKIRFYRSTVADVMVGYRTEAQRQLAFSISSRLREQGLKVDTFSGNKKIAGQLEYANKTGISHAVLAMAEDSIVVRDMNAGEDNPRKQQDVPTIEQAMAVLSAMRTKV